MEAKRKLNLLELIRSQKTKSYKLTLIFLKRTLKGEIIEKLALEESKPIEVDVNLVDEDGKINQKANGRLGE